MVALAEKATTSGASKDSKQKGGEAMENVKITPEARKMLEEVASQYAKLRSFSATGVVTITTKFGQGTQTTRYDFQLRFAAPNKFKLECSDRIIEHGEQKRVVPGRSSYGCTGKELYGDVEMGHSFSRAALPEGRLAANSRLLAAISPALHDHLEIGLLLTDGFMEHIMSSSTSIELAKKTDRTGKDRILIVKRRDGTTLSLDLDEERPILKRQTLTMPHGGGTTLFVTENLLVEENADLRDFDFAWNPPAGATDLSPPMK